MANLNTKWNEVYMSHMTCEKVRPQSVQISAAKYYVCVLVKIDR